MSNVSVKFSAPISMEPVVNSFCARKLSHEIVMYEYERDGIIGRKTGDLQDKTVIMKDIQWICPESGEACRPASCRETTVFCLIMVASLLGWFFLAGLVFKLFMAKSG